MLTVRLFARRLALVVCAAAMPLRASRGQAPHVETFHGSSGLIVSYPASWKKITDSRERLDIIVGPYRSTGTVIGPQTANIVVRSVDVSKDSSLHEQMDGWARAEPLLRDTIITAPAVARGKCDSLRIMVTRDEILPGRPARYTTIGCAQSGRALVVLLMHFEDEASGPAWLSVALEIARTARWAKPQAR